MEPVIQYATTSDGVSIAYSTMGEGPVLLFTPVLPLSHLQVEWQMPGMREFIEAFAATHQIVRFDARGLGRPSRRRDRTRAAAQRERGEGRAQHGLRLGRSGFPVFD